MEASHWRKGEQACAHETPHEAVRQRERLLIGSCDCCIVGPVGVRLRTVVYNIAADGGWWAMPRAMVGRLVAF